MLEDARGGAKEEESPAHKLQNIFFKFRVSLEMYVEQLRHCCIITFIRIPFICINFGMQLCSVFNAVVNISKAALKKKIHASQHLFLKNVFSYGLYTNC